MSKGKNIFFAFTAFAGLVGLCITIAGCILLYFLKSANLNIQVHLWLGFSLIVLGLITNFKTIFGYFISSRGQSLMSSVLLLILGIYIVICINYISFRHRVRYDFTETNRYTLSDKTIKTLNQLKGQLQFIVNENIPENSLRDMNELLNQFQFHSSKITVRRYNPLKYPDLAVGIQRDFALKPTHLMIVASDTKATTVDKAHLIDSDTEKIQWFKGEQAILNAILSSTNKKVTKIYFLQGHGESSFSETDPQKQNLLQLKNWLMTENFSLQDINLTEKNEGVPDDCDILAIINPMSPCTPDEINKLENYLNKPNKSGNKGRLFFAMSANFSQIAGNRYQWIDTGIETLLLKYGILVENKIVIEPELTIKSLGFFSVLIPPQNMAPHSITEPFTSNNLNLAWGDRTRAISPTNAPDKKLFFNPLLISSAKSKAISDVTALFNSYKNKQLTEFLADRESKPACIAAWAGELNPNEKKEKYTEDDILKTGTKIIAVGNGAFLNSPIKETDRDFFINCIRYLTSEKELIGNGTNISQRLSWTIQPEKEWFYREIIFYLMPLLWVFIGGFVWWVRKN